MQIFLLAIVLMLWSPKHWTSQEVAERFRTSPETVRFWVYSGKLSGFKVGRRRLFTEAELDRFEAEAQADAESKTAS